MQALARQPVPVRSPTQLPLDGTILRSPIAHLTDDDRQAWQRLVDIDPAASIETRPEIADLRGDADVLRLLETDSQWRTAVILLPEEFRVRQHLLPGSRTHLRGFRLAGNQLISVEHDADTLLVVAALADELLAGHGHLLALEDVPHDTPLWNELHRLQQRGFQICTPLEPQPHHRLILPDTADEYWSRFSSKTRSTTRRRRRKLNAVLKRYEAPDDVNEFLRLGHDVSLKTWQWHSCQLALPDDNETRMWYARLAEHGLLRSYILFSGDQPIAYATGWQSAGTFCGHQTGYDQEYAKHGPGRILISSIIDDLYEHDRPDVLDFGPGHMPYKAEFANSQTMTATVWVLPPGLASWRIVQSLRWRQRSFHAARVLLTRLGLFSRLRALSRGTR